MIKAYAKVNLILRVIGKNENQYHLLQMLNARINIYDEIEIIKLEQGQDQLLFLNSTLSSDTDTLVLDVLHYFKHYFKIQDCFQITITKHIPVGAGLGGGSCDVGAILQYLGQFYHMNIFVEPFLYGLQQFGADILYALYMKPCIVEGIGDRVTEVNYFFPQEFLCIYPNLVASTKEVFQNNEIFHPEISHQELMNAIKMNGFQAFYNDLEEACARTYPIFQTIMDEIRTYGHAIMSGSGSSIIVFCDDVERVYNELTKKYKHFYIKKVKLVEE